MQKLHVLKKPQFVLRVRNSGAVFYFLVKGIVKAGAALFPIPFTSSCHRGCGHDGWSHGSHFAITREKLRYLLHHSFIYWVGSFCLFPGCKYSYHG